MKHTSDPLPRGTVPLVLGTAALYWGLNNLSAIGRAAGLLAGFVFPFLLGGGFAFLLNIPMRALEGLLQRAGLKSRFLRPAALLLTLLAVAGVLTGVTFVVVPQLGATAQRIGAQIPDFLTQCQAFLSALPERFPWLSLPRGPDSFSLSALPDKLTEFLSSLGSRVLGSSISFATTVFSGVVNFGIAFVFALYILVGKETLSRQLSHLMQAFLPERWNRRIRYALGITSRTFSGFFTGQVLEACILGFLFFVSMTLLRFPYATLVAVLVGFTALIPVFGAFIGCVVSALLILVENPVQALWFIVLFLVLQQLEGNLIYPRVVGSSVGLPPIWVLVAVTLGGSMFGIAGMLVFIPTVSVVYQLLRDAVRSRLQGRAARPAPDSPERPERP
mgnify:FL=1